MTLSEKTEVRRGTWHQRRGSVRHSSSFFPIFNNKLDNCLRTKAPLWELRDPEPSVKECGRGLASHAFGNRQTELHAGTEPAEPLKRPQLLLLQSDKTLGSTGCAETHGKEHVQESDLLKKMLQHTTGENKQASHTEISKFGHSGNGKNFSRAMHPTPCKLTLFFGFLKLLFKIFFKL